jgi:hypothetical protein
MATPMQKYIGQSPEMGDQREWEDEEKVEARE